MPIHTESPFEEANDLFTSDFSVLRYPYMVTRILSMNRRSINAAIIANQYGGLPSWVVSRLLYCNVSKSRVAPRFNYIKKGIQKPDSPYIALIAKFFICSKNHAMEIEIILGNKRIKELFGSKKNGNK